MVKAPGETSNPAAASHFRYRIGKYCVFPKGFTPHKANCVAGNYSVLGIEATLYRHGDTFQFRIFTMDEVWKAGYSIKSNAVGHDNLSIKFLTFVFPALVFSLTHVLNHVIISNYYQDYWKMTIITSTAKWGTPVSSDVVQFCVVGIVAIAIPLPQHSTAHETLFFLELYLVTVKVSLDFRSTKKLLETIDDGSFTLFLLAKFPENIVTCVYCSSYEHKKHYNAGEINKNK
uniref:Uncharacterized protein n=1 Tax=Glossina austeni TaxID=7395 RepID=A0A1A9VJ36_GLOAU